MSILYILSVETYSAYVTIFVSLLEIISHDFKGIVRSEALNLTLINVANHFHLLNGFDFVKNNNNNDTKNKKINKNPLSVNRVRMTWLKVEG